MKWLLKKLLWIVLIVGALDIGIILALPHIVPMEKVAAEAKDQVRRATGRELNFSGVEFVFWPNIGIELKQATFSNPVWAKERNMISLGKIDVALALMPLFERHIVVKRFILSEPVIHLEIGEDGRKNWDFANAAPGTSAGTLQTASGSGAEGFDFQFGRMKISKGKLIFVDHQKGGSYSVGDIDVEASLPDLKSALQLDGALTYKEKRVDLEAWLEKPADFFNGKTSPGRVILKTEDLTVKAEGIMASQGTLLKGTMEAAISSLAKALAWTGGGKEQKQPFEKVSFTGDAQVTKTDIILKGAVLKLDEVQAKGDMNVSFTGKPDIFARLSLNKLNLDRFTGSAAGEGGGGEKKAGGQSGWDTTPIDFSGLREVNADLQLKTEGFSVRGVDVGPSVLTVQLQDANLHFKSSEAGLFDGRFASEMTINAAGARPAIAFAFSMAGVQAKPVLTTFADFKKLSGAADAKISVTASGNNQKALISTLAGSGSAVFRNGSLEGIDLVKIAKMVQNRLTDMGVGEGKTDFVEMGGTFTINAGIASNNDLKMKGPLLQATGQGIIDLPQKYVQYRAIPVLTASSAVEGASGLAVPVDIKGPFSDIKIRPDFAAVVTDVLKDPSAAKQTLKNIKEQGKALGLDIKTIKKDPMKGLQNLLGGGLIQQPTPVPEPVPEAAPAPAPVAPEPAPAAPAPESPPSPPPSEPSPAAP